MSKKRNKNSGSKPPKLNAGFVEAFMIMMLHKIGGSQTLTMKQLNAFDKASGGKHTEFSYDKETDSVTISAPDYVMPEKPVIIQREKIILS